MKIRLTSSGKKDYDSLPPSIVRAADKQLALLRKNIRHPSLHAKKYNEARNVWQARVNKQWRLYFTIELDIYWIVRIIPHPK